MFNINGRAGKLIDVGLVLVLAGSLVGYGRLLQAVDELKEKDLEQVDEKVIAEKFAATNRELIRLATTMVAAREVQTKIEISVGVIEGILVQQYGTLKVKSVLE